ncbi:uncharacterized protein EV420DRAFT_1651833 [Desarmillaria tabescens]|uniref:Uncharacterized protein n=1 Tax=Armillaria tabescens TaxID=1929756 RepID=A0AA39J8M6_ARMTA|nr:uncharacterized protein EV420DRAFT_1651833 [Desarmillaria tabescens]KAK0437729.1 hypothetical protein EV420DRAFT_1651833 [Desarmillaria tabescens]
MLGAPQSSMASPPPGIGMSLDSAEDADAVEDPYDAVELPPVAPPDTNSEGLMDVDAEDHSEGHSEPGLAVEDDTDDDSDKAYQPSSDLEDSSTHNLTEADAAELTAFHEWKRVQMIDQKKTIARHKQALKAEKAKHIARESINAVHKVPPTVIGVSKGRIAAKHKETSSLDDRVEPQKCSKGSTVGGLAKNWEAVYMQPGALASTTFMDGAAETQFNQGGVLEKEEAHKATLAARAAKGGHKSEIKKEHEVVLQPAAVAEINKKEHEKKPAKAWTQWTNKDLPLSSHHLQTWQQKVIPHIIDWSTTLSDSFASNNHPEFKNVVAQEWIRFFENLQETVQYEGKTIKRVDHPPIYHVAMSAMQTYRRKIGKYAMACMDNLWLQEDMKQYNTVES